MYNYILGDTQFPIAPGSMTLTVNNQNETVTLVNEGQVNILKKPGLSDVTFDLLLPNKNYPFAVYDGEFRPASYYLEQLERYKVSQEPLPFIVNRILPNGELTFDTNLLVSLEDYTINEDAEELGFDVMVSINLKQWREYGTKRLKVQQAATPTTSQTVTAEKTRPVVNKPAVNSVKVKQGDTLYGLAKKYLGDGNRYREIQTLNNIKNPSVISIGQDIKIPKDVN